MIKIDIKQGEDVWFELYETDSSLPLATDYEYAGAVTKNGTDKFEFVFSIIPNTDRIKCLLDSAITYTMPSGTYKGEIFISKDGIVSLVQPIQIIVNNTTTDLTEIV